MKTLWNWLAAKKAARNVVDSVKISISPAMVESLEDRCLLSKRTLKTVSAEVLALMVIVRDFAAYLILALPIA